MARDTHNITASRSTDWLFEVSRGKVPGHQVVVVDSLVPNIDISDGIVDIWTGGGALDYLETAETMGLGSTSTDDTFAGGIGTRLARIDGIDDDYREISEIVSMDGTNSVVSTQKFLRVFRIMTLAGGTNEVNVGDITAVSSDTSKLQCHCQASRTRSKNSQYTVPAGKSFISVGLKLNGSRTAPGALFPCILVNGDTRIRIPGTSLSLVREFQLRVDTRLGHFPMVDFPVIDPLKEKTDIRLCASTDTNDTELRATLFGVQYASDIA